MRRAEVPEAYWYVSRSAVAGRKLDPESLLHGSRLHSIIGVGGSGKTTLASAALIEAIVSRLDQPFDAKRFFYVSAAYGYKAIIRESYDDDAWYEQMLREVGLLVIDGLHSVPVKAMSHFYRLIADRCDTRKVTIVTCDTERFREMQAEDASFKWRSFDGTTVVL